MTDAAKALAESLPICDQNSESDLISLCDIVVTGIEVPPHPSFHFRVRKYNHEASGEATEDGEWALIEALPSAEQDPPNKHVSLNKVTMRTAVRAYLQSRLDSGLSLAEASKLVDGSYTDAEVADSILQFALYGKEIYS